MTLAPLRVAAVQAVSVAGDVDANVATAVHWVGVAAAGDVRVVILPELFLTGYDPATWKADRSDVTVDDERLMPLARAAEKVGAAVLAGASVRAGERGRTLSTLCCSPAGGIGVAYSKQHLWQEERAVFAPGAAGGSVVIDGWHLGMGICYDGCFPEHARAAADAGALGYLCPSAYVVGSEHRRDLYYAARALDNGMYVVMAALTGLCGELAFSGGTAIYDPQGRRVAAVPSGEGLAVTDLDPAVIAEARAINPYADDRPASLGGRVMTRLPTELSERGRSMGRLESDKSGRVGGIARAEAEALDAADPLAGYRDEFVIADESLIYLDGNSLGRLPKATAKRVHEVVDEDWGDHLIRSWTDRWFDLPSRIGDLIGTSLLGTKTDEVIVGDSTTVALYKVVSACLDARPNRRTLVIEKGNFPTDRYIVESLAAQRDLDIRWLEETGVNGVSTSQVEAALDPSVAAVVLSHVDYRSAALLDMTAITAAAHAAGALTVWDLCHSVGVVPINLRADGVDAAVGCTYKYLNGGPGAPAFTYVRRERQAQLKQPIWGWWSRREMFDMAHGYQAYAGMKAWLTGTPSIVALAAVEPGVAMIAAAGVPAIRAKSTALTDFAVRLYDEWLAPGGFGLASPRDASARGSHVTVSHRDARALTLRLIDNGVVPDFRQPDGIRLGFAPLTTRYVDVYDGLRALTDLVS